MEESARNVTPPDPTPTGHWVPGQYQGIEVACRALSDHIEDQLRSVKDWEWSRPVKMGSWALGTLTPLSDLDLGFLGSESHADEVVRSLRGLGYRVKPRVLSTEAINDWPEIERAGLVFCESLHPQDQAAVQELQKVAIKERSQILKALKEDQRKRTTQHSLENLLEPHLKNGAGGLRDLTIFLIVQRLWPDLPVPKSVQQSLTHCHWHLLSLRWGLSGLGAKDFLQAGLQPQLANWMGYADFRELMRYVQMTLSRVLFYSEWGIEWAQSSAKNRKAADGFKLRHPPDFVRALKGKPSLLAQFQVRSRMDSVFTESWRRKNKTSILRWQFENFHPSATVEQTRAFFRTRLADLLDPRLRKLVGYNQHDQYHAFTADAHILNLLLKLKAAVKSPRALGFFGRHLKVLSPQEIRILTWTCYYHDLAKGSPGDHEKLGVDFVRADHGSKGWAGEVQWLVRNHLELARAAFRKDPNALETLQELQNLELSPFRLRLLALFTCLDIQATHPQAWTPWKEKLLADLFLRLKDPDWATQITRREALRHLAPGLSADAQFLRLAPWSVLVKDLKRCAKSPAEVKPFLLSKLRKGYYWVRYFQAHDQKGILLKVLGALFNAGTSVEQAFVMTAPLGVYDWFLVKSSLDSKVLLQRLQLLIQSESVVKVPACQWGQIEWAHRSEKVWSLRLRGRDQRGLLLKAVKVLNSKGAEIVSAQAQTWGRQVEDLIEIRPLVEPADVVLGELSAAMTSVKE